MTPHLSTSTRAGGMSIRVERTITINDAPSPEYYLLRQLQSSLHSLPALPHEPGKCRFLPLRNRLLRHSEQVSKSAPAKIDMPTQENEGERDGIERSERWTRTLPEDFDDPGHLTCPIEARVKSDGDDDQQMSHLSRADWKVRCASPTIFDRLLLAEISLSSDCVQV